MSLKFRLACALAPVVAVACAPVEPEPVATDDASMTSEWFAANLPAGSDDAKAVLALVNDATRSQAFYVTECGFTESQAAAVVSYRAGDEPASSVDDRSFADLGALDDLPFTDAGFWRSAIACARRFAPPPPPPPVCPTSNTCATSLNVGEIDGDLAGPPVTVTGATSYWLTLRVHEGALGIFSGQDLRLRATLESPPGRNFDLFVYVPDNDVLECTRLTRSSTSTTNRDVVSTSWGEGVSLPDGIDNSRTVTIEVREAAGSGPCDPSAKWKLRLESFQ